MINKLGVSALALLLILPLLGAGWADWNVEAAGSSILGSPTSTLSVTVNAPPTSTPDTPIAAVLGGVSTNQNPLIQATISPTPVIRLDIRAKPVLYAFVRAPTGIVSEPYVIVSAYRSIPVAGLQIQGRTGNMQFVCSETPCRVPVAPNSQLAFEAEDPFGGTSTEIRATVRVQAEKGGYIVILEQVSQYFAQRDSCAVMWGFDTNDTSGTWNELPQQPELLATRKPLHYLSGQLIRSGFVKADDCPGKGFDAHGAPNLCGMERAQQAMITWQNSFDFDIWLAAKDVQIPPRVLKVLLEKESQFWPSNNRSYVDEIGLGQINQLGIDVLIRNNPALYQQICPSVLADCSVPYPALSEDLQKMIRGALLNSLNAYCPTCPNTLDLTVARQSITMIALLMRANCQQVSKVMDLYQAEASYEDLWKFTLMSYHSGLSCVENAVEKLDYYNEATDWRHVSKMTACKGAADYVENFWTSLNTFDDVRLPLDDGMGAATPLFLPTPTPIPTIGPPPSQAQVWVIIVLDGNRNGVPEEGEWVNGIPVTLRYADGTEVNSYTENGKAVFDMRGYVTGMPVTISLPTLYRTSTIFIPERGIVPVVFVFFPPPLTPETP